MNTKNLILVFASVAALGCSSSKSAEPATEKTAPVANPHVVAPAETATPVALEVPTVIKVPATTLIEIKNGALYDGYLVGGQPTAEQYEAISKAGYGTVIDMRVATEGGAENNKSQVEALKMTYLSLPIGSADDMNQASVKKFSEFLAAAKGPVVVHCASSNRVGAMFALKEHWIDNVDPVEAVAHGKQAGLKSLEGSVTALLGLSN